MFNRRAALSCAFACAALASCESGSTRRSAPIAPAPVAPAAAAIVAKPAPPEAIAPAAPGPKATHLTAGSEISIPAGSLLLGSATGSTPRNPAREADAVPLQMAAFAIDALPYPNDPAVAPRSSVSRDEAARLCGEQGKRLCSELEWERACKGDDNAVYPSQGTFDALLCAREPTACVSSLGVAALGTLGREWTASAAGRADWDRMRSAVVRGASKDAEPAQHRCAARDAAAPESRSESLLFRCCRGEAPRDSYPEQPDPKPFRPIELDTAGARKLLETMPETRAMAPSFRLHRSSELTQALTQAGRSSASLSPWLAASPAFAWSPMRGEAFTLLSGDTQSGATLVAFYLFPDGSPRLAGSYVTKDEHIPLLVAYKEDTRGELLFSTCWGCGGEGGALQLSPEGRLRFLQR
jgi:hypothetical protein